MANSKVIVLAEVTVLPEHLEKVKAISSETLMLTLKEKGCEVFYQTFKKDDPNTLVFFEVFESKAALELHMEADYTKNFFAGIKDKLAGKPVSTILSEL